jgi:hypothetical protein
VETVFGPLCHEFESRRDRGTQLPQGLTLRGDDDLLAGLLTRRQALGCVWRCGGHRLGCGESPWPSAQDIALHFGHQDGGELVRKT